MKNVVIQINQSVNLSDLISFPDFFESFYDIVGPDQIYEYFDHVPSDRSIQLAISDDPVTLSTIPAEQKIILGHPAPPNSNWYSVNSFKDITDMLEFDRYLTINNITIGGITYAS